MSTPQEANHRVVLVLGGTGGIGSAVCQQLKENQVVVVSAARNEARLRAQENALGIQGMSVDATKVDQVEALVSNIVEAQGHLDGIVNAVGSILLKPAHLTTADEWEQTLSFNLTSAFATIRAGAKVMRRRGGSIVLISSAVGAIGLSNHEAIAAAKAGVAGLTRSAAATYARSKIRVNAVAPGLVRTPLTQALIENDRSREASENLHALKRLGEPDEVASAIVWLLDPTQDWVTGQVLGVDGGLSTLHVA